MAVNLSYLGGAGWQFFDANGVPLAGGLLYTYAAGTTTPLTTYTSYTGVTPNSNPIVLDSAGRVPEQIWVNVNTSVKYVLKTATGAEIWTKDHIASFASASAADIDFIAAGIGAVTRTSQSKMRDIVSVKDFGATGNGVTDDTAAIQLALNAVSSGGALFFPSGSYVTDNTLSMSNASGVRLVGDDATLLLKASVTTAGYALTFTDCSNIEIENISFSRRQSTTTGANMSGIVLFSCQKIKVISCDFSNCFYGVAISGTTSACTDIEIQSCSAYGVLPYSVSNDTNKLLQGPLVYTQSAGSNVSDVLVDNCFGYRVYHMILAEPYSERIVVTNNVVRQSHDSSIYLRSSASVIANNTVYNAGKDGIKILSGTPSSDYRNNTINNNVVSGAGINKSDGGVLISAQAENTVVCGNSLQTTTDTTAAPRQYAIFIGASYGNVADNVIYGRNSSGFGLYARTNLGDMLGLRIENNTFRMTNGYGIALEPSSSRYIKNAAIVNNTISGADAAIYATIDVDTEWFEDIEISNNKISSSNLGVALRGALRPVIRGNMLNNGTGTFFFSLGGLTGAIVENNAMDASALFQSGSGATPTYYRRNNNLRAGADQDAFVTLAANSATPSVNGANSVQTNNSAPTTITTLNGGYAGMAVTVLFADGNTTVDFTGTNLKGNNGVDWTATVNDTMTCSFDGTNWYCDVSNN